MRSGTVRRIYPASDSGPLRRAAFHFTRFYPPDISLQQNVFHHHRHHYRHHHRHCHPHHYYYHYHHLDRLHLRGSSGSNNSSSSSGGGGGDGTASHQKVLRRRGMCKRSRHSTMSNVSETGKRQVVFLLARLL